jgi:GT2 family glycosyltransferase
LVTGDPADDVVKVLVTVVSFNSAAQLPDLLASLPRGMGKVRWQTIVADNGSTDDSMDIVRRLDPKAVVVPMGRNAGYSAGINAAVAAGGPYDAVLALNPDVRLDPGCVPVLLEALREPGVGIAVPRLRGSGGARIDSMRREPTLIRVWADALIGAHRAGRSRRLGEMVTDEREYDVTTDTEWAEGSTQLISAECWRRCGGWDESYFLYSEETDFHVRAREAGLRIRYVPTAGAVHLEGESATSPRLWALLVANRLMFFRRRNARLASAGFWLALVIREASRALRGSQTSRAALGVLFRPALLRAPRGPHWLEQV